jgi:hypothetical protein
MAISPAIQPRHAHGRPLSNLTCPYCAEPVNQTTRRKEHVIGRRFVPKGTLDNCWNLILWSCDECNGKKSDLEDDISAITMNFHTAGLPHMGDALASAEATRKSRKSVSRATSKLVAESSATHTVEVPLPGHARATFSFSSPPQVAEQRAYELARLQMMGFFYFLTYDPSRRVGHWWPGGFYPVHGTIKSDWGNPVHRAFMNEVAAWDYRLTLTTASGYFRAIIRRHPTQECWSWAVEWNDCYRLVGFFGTLSAAQEVVNRLPDIPVRSAMEGNNRWVRYRVEEHLPEDDDILFHVDTAAEA